MSSQQKEKNLDLSVRDISILKSLMDEIPSYVLNRGRFYYTTNHIQRVVKNDSVILGEVIGNRIYKLSIDLEELDYHCNCPANPPCKHIASVIFWSLNHLTPEGKYRLNHIKSNRIILNNELVFFFQNYYPNSVTPFAKTPTNKFLKISHRASIDGLREDYAEFLESYLQQQEDNSYSRTGITCDIMQLSKFMEQKNISFEFYTEKNSEPLKYGGEALCYPVIHPENAEDASNPDAEYALSLFQYNPYSQRYEVLSIDSILYQSDVLFPVNHQGSILSLYKKKIIEEYLEGLPIEQKPDIIKGAQSEQTQKNFYIRKLPIDKTRLFQIFYWVSQGLDTIYQHRKVTSAFMIPALKDKLDDIWKAGPALSISIRAKEDSLSSDDLTIQGRVEFLYAKHKKSLDPKLFEGKTVTLSSQNIMNYPPEKLQRKYGNTKIDVNESLGFIRRNLRAEKILLEKTDIPFSYKKLTGEFRFTKRFLKRLTLQYLEQLRKQKVILRLHESLLPAIYSTYRASFDIENSSKINWFEGEIQIPGISPGDTKKVLKAYREHEEIVKLSNGKWIVVDSLNLENIFRALNETGIRLLADGRTTAFNRGQLISFNVENDFNIRAKEKINKLRRNFEALLSNSNNPHIKIPVKTAKFLRDYQQEGVYFLSRLFELGVGGILADDMGLGKTLQSLAFIQIKRPGQFLVVTPLAGLSVWENESKKFTPEINIQIWHGLGRGRSRQKEDFIPEGLILTTYATLSKNIELFQENTFETVFLDEAQNIKNAYGQSAKAVRLLNSNSFFCLTGTPVENYLSDLWSLMDIAFPGLLGSKQAFKKNYGSGQNIQNKEKLLRKIAPFILRRTKQQVLKELPPKTETAIYLPLQKEQAIIYKEVQQEAIKALKGAGKNYLMTMLPYLMKLCRICCHPMLRGEGAADIKLSGKLSYLSEKSQEINKNSSGVLVFSQFTDVLKLAARVIRENKIDFFYLDGGTPVRKRKQMVHDFQNGEKKFFLISLKAGGTALTLHRADTVFHLDPWWNPAAENQATDRAHRIGQKKPISVYKLIAQDTIEEKVLFLQERKKQMFDTLLNENAYSGKALSREDLMEILS